MPGIAHLGIALISKRYDPKIPLIFLIISSYLIDIIFFAMLFIGIEGLPDGSSGNSFPLWSHSLLMAVIWSVLGAIFTWIIYGKYATSSVNNVQEDLLKFKQRRFFLTFFIGIIIFSHWILDFISSPMTAVFPTDTGKQILPIAGSTTIGLGLMSTLGGVVLIEGGFLFLGLVLYFPYKIQFKSGRILSKSQI